MTHKDPECRCLCCRIDLKRREGERSGQPYEGPPYGARDRLDCPDFMKLGLGRCFAKEEAQWWEDHEEHFRGWIRGEVEGGHTNPDDIKSGARVLLTAPTMRFDDKPFCEWDEIDGHEVFFNYLGHGGIAPWQVVQDIVYGACSFARYLGEQGAIPPDVWEDFGPDLELWAPRILEYFADGIWYTPEGAALRDAS